MKEIFASRGKSLSGKLVVLGVTGSVACIKSFELARELIRNGAKVQVVMSAAAQDLVSEKLMHFASGRKVITRLSGKTEHIKFFGKNGMADLLLVAPATANTISKIAMAIDDTPITTFASTAIGSNKPVLIAPAMHEPMYRHPVVEKNISLLEKMKKVKIIQPLVEEQKAKLSSIEGIILEVQAALSKKTLSGKKVLVAAGTTAEKIDQVRIITTSASGKTGKEIAKEAFRRGAKATLLHNVDSFFPQIKSIKFSGADELYKKTLQELSFGNFDFFFCPAAVSDFSLKKSKIKLSSGKKHEILLFPRKKLLQEIRKKFPKLFIAGFKAEVNVSRNELEKKCKNFLKENNFAMVVGNDISKGGFGSDFNEVVIVFPSKKSIFVKGKKELIAKKILDNL